MLKAKLKSDYLCKVCRKVRFQQRSAFHDTCSLECAIKSTEKAKEKREKAEKKVIKDKLKEVKQDRSYWLKKVERVCNRYVKLRDAWLPCISCGVKAYKTEAGHYRSVGSSPSLRYNLSNIHKQCHRCNVHLSGNLVEYRYNLVKKIGIEEVEKLEGPQEPKYYRIPELVELYKYFCNKIKQREKELEDERNNA